MPPPQVQIINPRVTVILDDDTVIENIRTIVADFMGWEATRKKYDLPTREVDPIPFLGYLAWAALRRTQQIEEIDFEDFIGGIPRGSFKPGRMFDVTMANGADAVDPTKPAAASA